MARRSALLSLTVFVVTVAAIVAPRASGPPPPAPFAQMVGTTGNPVPNPSFEDVDGTRPRGWRTATWQRSAEFQVDPVGHTGSRSARISSKEGGDASWTVLVVVDAYAKYRLTGWIKTENVEPAAGAKGALFSLHGLDGVQTEALTGTHDWTLFSLEFETTGMDAVQIDCLFGGWGKATGTAWYDDVRLERLSVRTLQPVAAIDAGRTRAPMSKYIYGQFIEHLGRCIYGGLWAEMLEDRKFYYAVGDKESPWKASGGAESVRMDKERPFVGAQTPMVAAADGAGLAQGELALVLGKSYTGRIIVAGEPGAAPIRVSLVWGDPPAARQTVTIPQVGPGFRTVPLSFRAGATTGTARLEIVGSGKGAFRVGTVSLMPADNVEGFRPEVLRLLRELNSPVYRWPGGNFVSGYNWRDGIGEGDKRPPRKNPAWRGVEHDDVGIHEFMALCRLIGTEPYISVNSGLGNAQSAAEEVEYVNGAVSTPMGALRAANGHPRPYGCRWWSVGNEMYGDWQLGHMPLSDYVKKHQEFANAMHEKDPTIQLVGVGNPGAWDDAMLRANSGYMALLSEHFYCQERPGLMSHVAQIPGQVRRMADAMRKYRKEIPGVAEANIRVALDEWNYWYGPHVYGELGTQYFLKDALGIAAGLHEYSRQSDVIFMANYAQTVNVIGAIKTSKTEAVLDTTGLVLKLYRAHFGTIPVEIGGAPEPLDVAAAWTEDRKTLTVAIVNPTSKIQALPITVKGAPLSTTARLWTIAGKDEKACNIPGKPPGVTIESHASVPFGPTLSVPAMSVCLYEVPPPAAAPAKTGKKGKTGEKGR